MDRKFWKWEEKRRVRGKEEEGWKERGKGGRRKEEEKELGGERAVKTHICRYREKLERRK